MLITAHSVCLANLQGSCLHSGGSWCPEISFLVQHICIFDISPSFRKSWKKTKNAHKGPVPSHTRNMVRNITQGSEPSKYFTPFSSLVLHLYISENMAEYNVFGFEIYSSYSQSLTRVSGRTVYSAAAGLFRGLDVLGLESLEAVLGYVDMGDESVQLVYGVFILVTHTGQPHAHSEQLN